VDTRGAEAYVPQTYDLSTLSTALQGCRGCELYRAATQAVPGAGPRAAALMLIGEQPGDVEDREGEPFVGPAGRLLDRALERAGLQRPSVFLTNAVKHFRFEERGKRRIHKAPTVTHIRACAPWLEAELSVVRPTGVVLLGATAVRAIFGTSFRLTEVRGHVLDWPTTEPAGDAAIPAGAVATAHPSAVLRANDRSAAFDELVADLVVASRHLDG
jgi:uracil-DNA glycosylase